MSLVDSARDVIKRQVVLHGDTRDVVIFELAALHAVAFGDFEADRAQRRVDLLDAALEHMAAGAVFPDAQRGRVFEDLLKDCPAVLFSAKNAEKRARP